MLCIPAATPGSCSTHSAHVSSFALNEWEHAQSSFLLSVVPETQVCNVLLSQLSLAIPAKGEGANPHILLVEEGSADRETAVGEALTCDYGVIPLGHRLCSYRGGGDDCLLEEGVNKRMA